MKIHFQLAREDDVSREAKAKLSNLMKGRNQIAHPSASTSFPDANQVLEYVSFLRILAQVLTQICRVKVTAFSVTS